MNLLITNIQFQNANRCELRVPVNLHEVKEWLADIHLDPFIENRYEKCASYARTITDDEALNVYIRTALFQNDLTYDIEITETISLTKIEWQPLCMDAFDQDHVRYRNITLNVTVPDQFHVTISEDDLNSVASENNTVEEVADQLAFDYMIRYLPVEYKITVS